MRIRDQAIKELSVLQPNELVVVYDVIQSLKNRSSTKPEAKSSPPYLRVREALISCGGSMNKDVSLEREDRI